MSNVNKAIIMGRVGKDPEVKFTQGGVGVTEFSVATSKRWKDKQGQEQSDTQWHAIKVWGKLAEICGQHVKKGMLVFVEGEITTRSWEKDGQTKYKTEIVAGSVQFLSGQKPAQEQQQDDAGGPSL